MGGSLRSSVLSKMKTGKECPRKAGGVLFGFGLSSDQRSFHQKSHKKGKRRLLKEKGVGKESI